MIGAEGPGDKALRKGFRMTDRMVQQVRLTWSCDRDEIEWATGYAIEWRPFGDDGWSMVANVAFVPAMVEIEEAVALAITRLSEAVREVPRTLPFG